ncbi:MAG: hypothetical protein NMK33_04520 [Candidatus Cardinium sp.]|uniref:hypothetical protein n=1 Tax=Cardinium endosymbiont of Dermatophagoides farinae TaxID=2597823 RepID=UPI00118407B0|nr:hypothetical protein [Cardinium endosymbiont of Dermatophagoides farinae]TSJ80697.1 hypothetical protein FPG78_01285 [Cardinium endosymbiont of Dermatophagoides farinae]UWW96691.1 MAG: hypothetical protein NMK33_04520 [Candidatus Cardinium sp.]
MEVAYTRYPKWSQIFCALLEKAGITTTDLDGQNVLMHLLNRYTDIYRKYYSSLNEFIGGYNRSPSKAKSKAKVAKCIFDDVCKDKQEMLKSLLSHKHFPRIINHNDKKRQTILVYFKDLLSAIPEVDQQKKIIKMLVDAGLHAIATCLRLSD